MIKLAVPYMLNSTVIGDYKAKSNQAQLIETKETMWEVGHQSILNDHNLISNI